MISWLVVLAVLGAFVAQGSAAPCTVPSRAGASLTVGERTVVSGDSVRAGGRLRITCGSDELVGSDSVRCRRSGLWDAEIGECQATPADCGPLPNVDNGYWDDGSDTSEGTQRFVTCLSGYEILGRDTVICTPTGDWETAGFCLVAGDYATDYPIEGYPTDPPGEVTDYWTPEPPTKPTTKKTTEAPTTATKASSDTEATTVSKTLGVETPIVIALMVLLFLLALGAIFMALSFTLGWCYFCSG